MKRRIALRRAMRDRVAIAARCADRRTADERRERRTSGGGDAAHARRQARPDGVWGGGGGGGGGGRDLVELEEGKFAEEFPVAPLRADPGGLRRLHEPVRGRRVHGAA